MRVRRSLYRPSAGRGLRAAHNAQVRRSALTLRMIEHGTLERQAPRHSAAQHGERHAAQNQQGGIWRVSEEGL
jgi:hypothetical protein